jgi:hypothetical protein
VSVPRSPAEFVDWLAARHPLVAELRDEHVHDYEELLPHVLFGDITRHAAELARRAGDVADAADELNRLLQDLDDAMREARGTDDPVENVVWVSFVENASGLPGDPEEPLREQIRRFPSLAHALSHYE